MILNHLLTHGLFYSIIATGYLLIMMITFSPRVWGYTDYSQKIKDKVEPQTEKEKRQALIVGTPWLIFAFTFPIFSTIILKNKLGDEISIFVSFLNLIVLFILATIGDLVILDWLIVSKITPKFVIIPGTEKADYKDFSHHFKGHAKAMIAIIPILLIVAIIISIV